jgi:hypothetical protein
MFGWNKNGSRGLRHGGQSKLWHTTNETRPFLLALLGVLFQPLAGGEILFVDYGVAVEDFAGQMAADAYGFQVLEASLPHVADEAPAQVVEG